MRIIHLSAVALLITAGAATAQTTTRREPADRQGPCAAGYQSAVQDGRHQLRNHALG
jgi:hypothetical protein